MLAASGVAMVGVSFAILLDYGPVAVAAGPYWLEAMHLRHRTADDALAVFVVAQSRFFRPEVDRLVIDLAHPPDEGSGGPLERTARLLRLLAAPEIAVRHVAALAKAGRIDEAIRHARRVRVFAGASYA